MVRTIWEAGSSLACCATLAFMERTDFSLAAPPIFSATLAARALPSGLEAAGAGVEAALGPREDAGEASPPDGSPGGGGIVISMLVTGPSSDNGLSKSFGLP